MVFEDKTVEQISTADLEGFLASLNVAAETRNTFRRDIRTLWSFAEKRGWATATTAKNTERAKAIDRPPGILTPAEAAALLTESKHNDLPAFHAIGVFAGQFAIIQTPFSERWKSSLSRNFNEYCNQ